MTTESDFQEAARHPEKRNDFVKNLRRELDQLFRPAVRAIRYAPEGKMQVWLRKSGELGATIMATKTDRAEYFPTPRGVKYSIIVHPAAFQEKFGNFLSNLDHELFHCWDASNYPETFRRVTGKIFWRDMTANIRRGLRNENYCWEMDYIRAKTELRAIGYQEARMDERGVTEEHKEAIERYKNHWANIIEHYEKERSRSQKASGRNLK